MSLGITSLLLFLLHGASIVGLIILLIYSAIRFAGNRGIQALVFFGICLPLFFRVAAPLCNIMMASRYPAEAFAFISMAISAATSLVTPISILLLIMAIRRAQLSASHQREIPDTRRPTDSRDQRDGQAGPSEKNPYGPI